MEHLTVADVEREVAVSEDRLFQALDNRRIGIGTESLIVQVFGVHMAEREGWVQVASREHPTRSIIVHIRRDTTAGDITLALTKWAMTPDAERPVVIDAPRVTGH